MALVSLPSSESAHGPSAAAASSSRETALLLVIAAVQFVNIVDFMMVMPLGPSFSTDLRIDPAHLGIIGGAYTASASISGLLGAGFLDRFDRRTALVLATIGLSLGTCAGAAATGLSTLLAARILAGAFGGPATAISMSIVADLVPPARRGRAMGLVMGAFSVASVVGVPAGLALAELGGWRMPFGVVAGLGLLVALVARILLPSMQGHLSAPKTAPTEAGGTVSLFAQSNVRLALAIALVWTLSRFSLIPYIAPFVVTNLGSSTSDLSILYMLGGLGSLVVLRISGWMVDRWGCVRVLTASVLTVGPITWGAFIADPVWLSPMLLFPMFMGASAAGNVAARTLGSMVPRPAERARYQSAESALQHMGAALGASMGSLVLSSDDAGRIVDMPNLAWLSIGLSVLAPGLVWLLDRRLVQRA